MTSQKRAYHTVTTHSGQDVVSEIKMFCKSCHEIIEALNAVLFAANSDDDGGVAASSV